MTRGRAFFLFTHNESAEWWLEGYAVTANRKLFEILRVG
jgi:hypothetical protein